MFHLVFVVPVWRLNALMTPVNPVDIGYEATDFLRTPFAHQLTSDPANQAWQSLRHFPSGVSALITCRLGLFRLITTGQTVVLDLTANGNGLGYLSLAEAGLKIGKNFVSLCLGQLSVSHALFHFGR